MYLAAAVCPQPPMLVPELGGAASRELDELRDACDAAVAALVRTEPARVVVVWSGDSPEAYDEEAGGTLRPYGVDVRAGGPRALLPLAPTIGAWLLDRAGWTGPRRYATALPDAGARDALLVMADGTATGTPASPGFTDDRADGFDAAVTKALSSGDAAALEVLDVALGDDLWAGGTRALRRLGEAFRGVEVDVEPTPSVTTAPFGVTYWVTVWRPRG